MNPNSRSFKMISSLNKDNHEYTEGDCGTDFEALDSPRQPVYEELSPVTSFGIDPTDPTDNQDVNLNEDLFLSNSEDEYVPSAYSSSKDSNDMIYSSQNIYIPESNENSIADEETLSQNITPVHVSTIQDLPNTETLNHVRARKGKADPSQWRRNVRIRNRQTGQPYVTSKGILKPGKLISEKTCNSSCKKQCNTKFTDTERQKLFSSYWKVPSAEQKRQYIISLIRQEKKKTTQTQSETSRRKFSRFYQLVKNNETHDVCQKFFLATFNISESFVRCCLKNSDDVNIANLNARGIKQSANKRPWTAVEKVREHINLFPRVPSHYTRKDTNKEYLVADLNVQKMFELYMEWCTEKNIISEKLWFYRREVNNMNIAFHKPRKDMCDDCFKFNQMTDEEKDMQKDNHNAHLQRKEEARTQRNIDKALAMKGEINFAEFDLEAICVCPNVAAKQIYYKRRLALYNLTILFYAEAKPKTYCFCWHEGLGKKGSNEIGSSLLKFLTENANGKPFTLMSDTCGGQNRNKFIAALLLFSVETLNIPEIDQTFFEPGHSQMEVDNIHACIEKAKKNMPIFHPANFYSLIRKTSRKNPYNVIEMETQDFIDLKNLQTDLIKNTKTDVNGEQINWLQMRWIQYRKDDLQHIYFKYNLNDDSEFRKFKLFRRGLRRNHIELKKAYEGSNVIAKEKYDDLTDLCKSGIITPQYHNFYYSLKFGSTIAETEE